MKKLISILLGVVLLSSLAIAAPKKGKTNSQAAGAEQTSTEKKASKKQKKEKKEKKQKQQKKEAGEKN